MKSDTKFQIIQVFLDIGTDPNEMDRHGRGLLHLSDSHLIGISLELATCIIKLAVQYGTRIDLTVGQRSDHIVTALAIACDRPTATLPRH